MKRFLFSLGFVLAVIVSFNSCTKEYITNYPPAKTFIYTIAPNAWSATDDDKRIFHTMDLPELTRYYMDQGSVSIAMSGDGESSYDILPASFAFTTGHTVGGQPEVVPITFSVNYEVGYVTIYGEDPLYQDGVYVPEPNRNMIVKITLFEADYIE